MYGSWVLFLLILISSLPVVAVYIWFRIVKFKFSLIWFLSALLAGAAAFFPALVFQEFLLSVIIKQSRIALLFEYFIRVAFTEEISRLLLLLVLFWINSIFSGGNLNEQRCRIISDSNSNPESKLTEDFADVTANNTGKKIKRALTFNTVKKGTAAGLIAGFGFSILESARYAASGLDINIALLRIFTAALHGACGSRVGAAAVMIRTNPFQAFFRIIIAVAIHGVYNFMVTVPGLPSIAAFIIAASAFTTVILSLRGAK